eukprot:9631657-Ditylum_brightwellii.AAC.1
MDAKQNPSSSWKTMRMLKQGLQHHRTANRYVTMTKQDDNKAKTKKENAEVFTKYFFRVIKMPDPLSCDESVLPLVPTCSGFSDLAMSSCYNAVNAATMYMGQY